MTEKNLIRVYTGATSEKRIDIIIKNYTKFIGIVDGYTDGLRYMIECEKESSHRQSAGDLGVRVQTGGMTSNPTARKAINNVITREALINCDFSGNVLDGVDQAEVYIRDAYILRDMRKDYNLFNSQLGILGTEKETFTKYLQKEKTISDIAEDQGITYESARQQMQKIKVRKTEVIGGMMRIDLVSFEKWYANQVKYKKVDGEEPGKELREKSYSFKEAANILGIHDCDLYDIWKNEKLEYITVDFVRRIPVDIFEKWYADQDVYRKVTHIPTAEELENDYICLQDAADLLGISREKLAKIARSEEIGRLLDSTICNNKRWITRKSFQLFLNAQNVYYILDDGDEQEKDTVSLEIKEYISRQEAAELAGVSVSTVTKWMQSGEFQCVGAGKVLRVHRQQFLNWLNEHREGVI